MLAASGDCSRSVILLSFSLFLLVKSFSVLTAGKKDISTNWVTDLVTVRTQSETLTPVKPM